MSGGGTNNRSTRLLIGALSLLVSEVPPDRRGIDNEDRDARETEEV